MGKELSRRERKKRETRDRILSVAQKMLATQGFDYTTLEQIAEGADVSKKTFYNYFPNKDILLRQILDIEMAAAFERVSGTPNFPASPLAIICYAMEVTHSPASPLTPVLVTSIHSRGAREHIAELPDDLVDLVRQAQEQGEIRSDLGPKQVAAAIGFAYITAMGFCGGIYTLQTPENPKLTAVAVAMLAEAGIIMHVDESVLESGSLLSIASST